MLYRLNEAADRVFWGVSDRKLKEATHKVYFDGRLVVGGMRVHMCKQPEDTLGSHSLGTSYLSFETMYFTGLKLGVYTRMAGQLSAGIHLSLFLQFWNSKHSLSYSPFP